MGGLWCLASGVGALVTSFPQLLFTRAVVGVGEAGYLPASVAWLSSAFPLRRRQLALGLLLASQLFGTFIGIIAGGIIASLFGWRHALGILAIPGFIVALLIYRSRDYKNAIQQISPAPELPGAKERETQEQGTPPTVQRLRFEGLRLIAQTPSLWLVYLAFSMLSLSAMPTAFFLPSFFTRVHGLPLQEAAYISAAATLCTAIASPLGGWFMDRKSHFKPQFKIIVAIVAFGSGTALHLIAFGVVESLGWRITLILLASFISGSALTSGMTVTQELVPLHKRAFSSTACVITTHILGSVPGPWLAGRLSDQYDLTFAIFIMNAVCGTAMVLFLLLAKHFYTRDFQRSAPYRLAAAKAEATA
jgi:MFS family permease